MKGLRTLKRRRKENKTDYKARRILLESGIPRIVIRRTNKYFIVQVAESHQAQDKVLFTITSKDLLKIGWNKTHAGSLKSIPAGYLTGLMVAKKLGKSKGRFIIDLGMARTIPGCRIYSVVKGLIDGGLDISANEKVFPTEDRINALHVEPEIKNMIAKVKENIK